MSVVSERLIFLKSQYILARKTWMDYVIMLGGFSSVLIWVKKRTDDSGDKLPGSFCKSAIYAHWARS